jgi:tetratricopeptide (TPR) repeat protein
VLLRHRLRIVPVCLALCLAALILCPVSRSADRNADKDKKKEDKKEKVEPWVEIRTPHFIVASDGGEKISRHVAGQFEQVRRVFETTMPNAHLDAGFPIRILAARNGQSFATLFPEFPFDKRNIQPAGLFVPGEEKNYIGLRTNVSGPVPYEDIYQSYARLILKRSYHSLPPWLEEGYISVFGGLSVTDNGVRLGRPEPEDLSVLWESPLLPLDIVLHVDRSSGYYRSREKNTVYFAESRALVHYLLVNSQTSGSQMSGTKALDRYIAQVEGGADSLQAAQQVFGDLNQLQSKLEAYIKQVTSAPSEILVTGGGVAQGSPRTLSLAENEALIGDFAASRGKLDDAQEKLEDAVKQDPSLADAEQSLGFLTLRQGHLEDSEKHFARASELDPASALAFYGQGMVAMSRGGFVGVPVGAVVNFEKTVALNPDFAPAWYNLASIYALRPETLRRALEAAKRAAALAPGESGYQLQLSAIQERLDQPEDARKTAAQPRNSSNNPKAVDMAGPPLTPNSQTKAAPQVSATHASTKPAEQPSVPAISGANSAAPPQADPQSHVYSMVGTITEVNCADTPQVRIILKAQTLVMHLHGANFAQLAIKPAGTSSLAKTSCASLRGRSARISYLLVSGKEWDGEIQAVELRDQP